MATFLAEVCRVWFAITLTVTVLLLGVTTRVAALFKASGLISELSHQDFSVSAAAVLFRCLLLSNPQIRIKEYDTDWDALTASAPAMVLINHASFFDFFLFTATLPPSVIRKSHVRTVVSASLGKLPILGKSMGDHSGSFKVFFQAKGAGFGKGDASDFSVDRDRQQLETNRMEAHIETNRGTIVFCPEGGMNKTPAAGLNPFRRGSFAQAAKYSTPIWGAALTGCTTVWPRDAKIGGYPGTVAVSLKRLMVPAAGAAAAEVAEAAQAAMQLQVDDLAQRVGGGKPKAARVMPNRAMPHDLV